MAADSSIYSLIKPAQAQQGALDQYGDALKLKTLIGAQGLQDLQMKSAQQGLDDEQAVRQFYAGLQPGEDPRSKIADLYRISPKTGMATQKFYQDADKTKGETAKVGAETAKIKLETTVKAMDLHRNDLANVNTPEQAAQWVMATYNNPHLSEIAQRAGSPQEVIARIPTDPAGFERWKQQGALGMTKFIELNKPTIHMQNTGGMANIVSVPGLGGAPTVASSTPITQSADNLATNATSRANNAATVSATLAGQKLTDERARLTTEAGRIPPGYRKNAMGELEAIPGGPASQKDEKTVNAAQRTVDAYVAARDGLLGGLSGTATGPLAGRIPASTSEQQIAEGGVAAMAPVLKQIFRAAGEGTFTDKDQEQLMAMVPTRLDNADARATKMANIDRIISAKLGMPIAEWKPKNAAAGKIGSPAPGVLTPNPDGSFAYGRKP